MPYFSPLRHPLQQQLQNYTETGCTSTPSARSLLSCDSHLGCDNHSTFSCGSRAICWRSLPGLPSSPLLPVLPPPRSPARRSARGSGITAGPAAQSPARPQRPSFSGISRLWAGSQREAELPGVWRGLWNRLGWPGGDKGVSRQVLLVRPSFFRGQLCSAAPRFPPPNAHSRFAGLSAWGETPRRHPLWEVGAGGGAGVGSLPRQGPALGPASAGLCNTAGSSRAGAGSMHFGAAFLHLGAGSVQFGAGFLHPGTCSH